MGEGLLIGLIISGLGLGTTFLSLGLLILLIRLLVLLFPAGQDSDEETSQERQREELAASIAVAIGLVEQDANSARQDPALGKLLEKDSTPRRF